MRHWATSRCLACRGVVTSHGGHVHRGREIILAGWCAKHKWGAKLRRRVKPRCAGCYGTWNQRDGVERAW
jgi:hypothetical protein